MSPAVKSLATKLYSYAFFEDFILIYPLYAIMFADSGLSAGQISLLFIAWSITGFILEVPSGAVADKFSRKHVLVVAGLIRTVGYSFWLFMPNFWGFLIGFILWGVGGALRSGTEEALVYDELARLDSKPAYTKLIGGIHSFNLIGAVLAGVGAGVLARFGYTPIMICSIASVLITILIVTTLPSSQRQKSTGETRYFDYLRQGTGLVMRNWHILLIVLVIALLIGLGGGVEEYESLLLNERGFSNTAVSFLVALTALGAAAGSLLAHKIERIRLPLLPILIFWGGLLVLVPYVPTIVVPVVLILFFFFVSAGHVLFNTHLQNAIEDHSRATATSVSNLVAEVFALVSFGLFGVLTAQLGYGGVIRIIGVSIIGVTTILFGLNLYLRKFHNTSSKIGDLIKF